MLIVVVVVLVLVLVPDLVYLDGLAVEAPRAPPLDQGIDGLGIA